MIEPPVVLPPVPKLMDFPATFGLGIGVIFTALLLVIAKHFDPTGGVLTLSIMIVLAFVGAVTFSMFFTIPPDQSTSALIGGLVAAFGAVIAHWIGRPSNGGPK